MSRVRAYVRAVSTHLVDAVVEPQDLERALESLAARELAEVGHEGGELVDLGDHVVGDLVRLLVVLSSWRA